LALPLIVLPDISPRIVTGRKTLSSTISQIAEAALFSAFYGEKVPAGG
jgi:hypothetical protein